MTDIKPATFEEIVSELEVPCLCSWRDGECDQPAVWLVMVHGCRRSWLRRPVKRNGRPWIRPGVPQFYMCGTCWDFAHTLFDDANTVICLGDCAREYRTFEQCYPQAVKL